MMRTGELSHIALGGGHDGAPSRRCARAPAIDRAVERGALHLAERGKARPRREGAQRGQERVGSEGAQGGEVIGPGREEGGEGARGARDEVEGPRGRGEEERARSEVEAEEVVRAGEGLAQGLDRGAVEGEGGAGVRVERAAGDAGAVLQEDTVEHAGKRGGTGGVALDQGGAGGEAAALIEGHEVVGEGEGSLVEVGAGADQGRAEAGAVTAEAHAGGEGGGDGAQGRVGAVGVQLFAGQRTVSLKGVGE